MQIIRDMVSPEKIILFGSYAKGKMVHDTYISNGIFYEYISDIDILIVTAEELANEKELEYALMEKVDTMSQPVNL
ncbi:MAG TPA: nucleotidyltransferase domain-containing protein, partial [Sediminibacterium sp.]